MTAMPQTTRPDCGATGGRCRQRTARRRRWPTRRSFRTHHREYREEATDHDEVDPQVEDERAREFDLVVDGDVVDDDVVLSQERPTE